MIGRFFDRQQDDAPNIECFGVDHAGISIASYPSRPFGLWHRKVWIWPTESDVGQPVMGLAAGRALESHGNAA
jgi:hypothetical protein